MYSRIVHEAIIGSTKKDIKQSIEEIICDELAFVEANSHPLDMYIFNKSVRAKYKIRRIPHLRVVDLIKKRNESGEFVRANVFPGDRVDYVILKGSGKVSERSEDVMYFREHNTLKDIDRSWYVSNILNPIEQLTSLFLEPQWLKKKISISSKELTRQQSGHKKITQYFFKLDDSSTSKKN